MRCMDVEEIIIALARPPPATIGRAGYDNPASIGDHQAESDRMAKSARRRVTL